MRDYRTVIAPPASSVSSQLAPGQSQELTEPRRAPSLHSDVGVPLAQAVVTACVVALVPFAGGGIAIVLLNGSAEHWKLTALITTLVFAGALAKAWFWRMAWVEGTIDKLESLTGLDLPGNDRDTVGGYVVNGRESGRAKSDAVVLKRARFHEFISYAHAHATDTPTLRQGGYSQSEINEFRNLLIQAGAATWKTDHHNQGWAFLHSVEESLDIAARKVQFTERSSNYVE